MSVVIPTIGRPELVRAISSALDQSYPVHEILVCLDGDVSIESRLPDDPRVRLLKVGPSAGGNAARQAGIDAASGQVVALLDDDDTWHREKLREQIRAAKAEGVIESGAAWLATCRLNARFPERDEVWPKRLFRPGDRLDDYILRKHAPKGGIGFIQASTLLFPKELAIAVPFASNVRFHQDVDWLLKVATAFPELTVVQLDSTLVNYYIGSNSVSGGSRISPEMSTEWARSAIGSSARNRGDFILTISTQYALRRRSTYLVARTIWAGFRYGRPGPAAVAYAGYLLARSMGGSGRAVIQRRVLRRI